MAVTKLSADIREIVQISQESTQRTQRPKRKDRSGVYRYVAPVALRALRWMEARLNCVKVNSVVACVDVQYIFLVGGLSESPLLQQVTREKFSSRAQVLVPQEASLAVLKGRILSLILFLIKFKTLYTYTG